MPLLPLIHALGFLIWEVLLTLIFGWPSPLLILGHAFCYAPVALIASWWMSPRLHRRIIPPIMTSPSSRPESPTLTWSVARGDVTGLYSVVNADVTQAFVAHDQTEADLLCRFLNEKHPAATPSGCLAPGDLQNIAEAIAQLAHGPQFVLERKTDEPVPWLHGRLADKEVGIAFPLGTESPYETALAIANVAFYLGRLSR